MRWQEQQQQIGCSNIICRRQATHAQAHNLHFVLCVVIRWRQHTTMQAISHRAQAHKLSISHCAQAHELSISHCAQAQELLISHHAQAHKLSITAATTTYVDDKILKASAQGIYMSSHDSNNNNNGNDDDECRRQGHLGGGRRWWRPRARAPSIFISHRAAATMTTTMAMMMMNVNDKASGASAQLFYIASCSGNDDGNNYWQQQTMSVGWWGLVSKKTYSHCIARWQRRRQSQVHMLHVKHRRTNQPGNVKHRRAWAKLSNIDNSAHSFHLQ